MISHAMADCLPFVLPQGPQDRAHTTVPGAPRFALMRVVHWQPLENEGHDDGK